MVTKNKTQLNYLYGEEVTHILEDCIKKAIKDGKCVEVSIDSLDEFTYKHFVISKVKLFIKGLF
jgi:hypothetical protein